MIKFNQAVYQLIEPIAQDLTVIYMKQKSYPMINPGNEPEADKLRKRDCVHVIFNDATPDHRVELVTKVHRNSEGKLFCDVCGQEINDEFNDNTVQILKNAQKVLNGLQFHGMMQGLRDDRLNLIIFIKHHWPDIIQMQTEMNIFVAHDNQMNSVAENMGVGGLAEAYKTPERNMSFTRYGV